MASIPEERRASTRIELGYEAGYYAGDGCPVFRITYERQETEKEREQRRLDEARRAVQGEALARREFARLKAELEEIDRRRAELQAKAAS